MDDDIEDIFEDGLLSLFEHHPVAFSTPSPSHPYIYRPSPVPFPDGMSSNTSTHDDQESRSILPNVEIPVYLPVAPSALHTTLQLTHIWLSSILMADLIFSRHIPVRDLRICELGAGAGLPSVAALLNVGQRRGDVAGSVVATDYAVPEQTPQEAGQAQPEDVLGVLRGNLRNAAEMTLPCGMGKPTDHWAVVGHTWGESVDPILSSPACHSSPPERGLEQTHDDKFDLLLLADLLWSSSSHTDLLTSVQALLKPRTGVAHVIAGLHQGRGATERFKRGWKETGGWIEEVAEVRWGKEGWERFERRSSSEVDPVGDEERGVIVWFKVGR